MGGVVMDIFVILLIVLAVLGGIKRGLLVAVYNVVAIFVILMVVLHSYPEVTDAIKARFPVLPTEFGDFVSVGMLLVGSMLVARIFRELLVFFFVSSSAFGLERLFSALLSLITGVLTSAMFMFWIYLAPWDFAVKSVENGRLSRYLYVLPSQIYTFVFKKLFLPHFHLRPNTLVYLTEEKKK